MSENIGTADLFASGGHRWSWGRQEQRAKEFQAPGVTGAGSMVLVNGPRPGVIDGVLKATASTRAGADTALDALETAVETLRRAGDVKAWEDDQAHTGDSLLVRGYDRLGPRLYGRSGSTTTAWQQYRCEVRDLDGKP